MFGVRLPDSAPISVGGIAAIAVGCKPMTLETRRFESYPADHKDRYSNFYIKDIMTFQVRDIGSIPIPPSIYTGG